VFVWERESASECVCMCVRHKESERESERYIVCVWERVPGLGGLTCWRRVRYLGFESRPQCFRFWDSSFQFRVSDFGFRVSGFGFRVSGSGSRISGFEFRVSSFGFRVSDFGCRISDFRFRISNSGARRVRRLRSLSCKRQILRLEVYVGFVSHETDPFLGGSSPK